MSLSRELYPDNGLVGFVGAGSSFVGFSSSFVAFVVFVGFVRTGPGHGSSGAHGLTGSQARVLLGWRAHGLEKCAHGEDIENKSDESHALGVRVTEASSKRFLPNS